MRLWSLHPKYLDGQGLVALWREGLLARKVLQGETRGYKNHPQLERFRSHVGPVKALDAYMFYVWKEAKKRGYAFDRSKTGNVLSSRKIPITTGQLVYELEHLRKKLEQRDPQKFMETSGVGIPDVNPFFEVKPGPVAPWERIRNQ